MAGSVGHWHGSEVCAAEVALLLEGHTDDVGLPDYNLKLSAARAESVAKWLQQHGIPATLIETKGHGSLLPKYPNTSGENRARNRRVEISVLK